jgi:phosphohistidine phosphatase
MFLYLMQHGEALAEEHAPGRPLSLNGKQQVKDVARKVSHAGVEAMAIYHSDKLRARQSAEILGAELGLDVCQRPGLGPKDDVDAVTDWLQDQNEDLALIGHLPFLDRLTSRLVVGDASKSLVTFRFGWVVRLQRGPAGWKVDWMVRPDL